MLAEAAARIAGAARAVDTVGRIGGEEFAWLLPEDAAAAALIAAQRLRPRFRAAPFAGGLEVTASMGICDLATARDPETLLRRADEALYWSKAFGRDAALVWSARTAARIARGRAGGFDALAAIRRRRSARRPRPRDGARVDALAALSDAGHGARVAELAVALAEALGWEPAAQARLHQAARLHDLGKAALPDDLLSRPGPLSGPSSSTSASTRASAPASRRACSTPSRRAGSATTTNATTAPATPPAGGRRDPRGRAAARARRHLGHDDLRPPVPSARSPARTRSPRSTTVAGTHLHPDAGTLHPRRAPGWLPGTSQVDPSGL